MYERSFAFFALVLLVVFAAGCGGGSNNSSSNQTPNNPVPAVTGLTPPSATAGTANTSVKIAGSGFVSGSTVQWNGTSLTTTYISATALSATLPASDLANGTVAKITVANPAPGGGTSAATEFTVNNPVAAITAITPGSATTGSSDLSLNLTGTGFVPSSVVAFNGTALKTTFTSGTEVKATLPAADMALGLAASITAVNPTPAGGTSAAVTFDVNNPTPAIMAVSPSSLTAGAAGTTLDITGTGFVSNTAITWNGIALTTTYVSGTEVKAALPASDLAVGIASSIIAVNPAPAGGTSAAVAFNVNNPAPAITAVSPASLTAGAAATTLDITGTGFVSNTAIAWNGIALTTTFVSGTEIKAALPASDIAGSSTSAVTANNPAPGGGASKSVAVAVDSPMPVITSVNPASVPQGTATTVMVTGTGFETNSVGLWNGSPRTTTFGSPTSLQVALTSNDLQYLGTGELTISNPPPNASVSAGTQIIITGTPIPAIQSIMPSSIAANPSATGTTNLVITGTNFLSSSTVQVNNQQIVTSSISSTSITAQLPASFIQLTGQLDVVVINPGNPPALSTAVTVNVTGPPAISSVTPSAAPLGSADLQITVYGNGFFSDSVVQWNGTPLTTSYTGSALTATIPAAGLATFVGGSITVVSPEEAPTTTSSAQVFSTYLPISVNQLAYNAADGLVYVSVPGAAGPPLGNSVVGVDPVTGAIVRTIAVGSEPNALAISDDGTQLFVGLNGAGAVRQVNLTTGTPELQFSLGGGSGIYNAFYTAQGMAVVPGQPNSVAVYANDGVLTIYDSGVARPKNTSSYNLEIYFNQNTGSIAFASASTLYALTSGVGENLYELSIDSTGITAAKSLGNLNSNASTLQYDNGRLYLSNGTIVDASTGNLLGQFSQSTSTPATGPIVSDSSLNKAWVLPNLYSQSPSQILAFDETTFDPAGSINFSGYGLNSVSPVFTQPQTLLRWGPNGLVFASSSQLYSLQSPVVQDLSSLPADVSVSVSAPGGSAAGAPLTYSVTVSNAGPNPAQDIAVIPSTSSSQSASFAIQGSPPGSHCYGQSGIVCNISTLASGASVTIQITIAPNSPGTLISTASAYPVSYDPNLANNQASSTTTITGNALSPVPGITSLSPSFAQAGTGTFTLTVNGAYFDNGSVVNWNGNPLPTTLVGNTQLTANVDQSLIASMGWAAITVTNAAPGGGTSQALTLTIYQSVNLQANDIVFDPFSRQIYASVPSTATGITGNTLVALNPTAGSVGTPVSVGSEPNLLSETSDGNYMWIGIDGAKSIARFNLLTQQLDVTVPIVVPNGFPTGDVAAVGLSALPGSDATIAIDTGDEDGIGVFDLSGNSGAFRQKFSGTYNGNNPAFGDATHLYAHDNETTGNEFYAYSVDANGLTQIYNYTLLGFSAFGSQGFTLGANGYAYSPGGGIANPTSNPPQQIGVLAIGAGEGDSSLYGGYVIPDSVQNRVFIIANNVAGTAFQALEGFNTGTFLPDEAWPMPTNLSVSQGIRWGQDGIALNALSGSGTTNTYELLLFRGPFVLPAERITNAAPSLTGINPGSIAVNAGNQYLTITGTGFIPGAVALWNGAQRTTNFVDSSHLSVAIPASDVTAAATITLKVDNPGSGDSNSISLMVQ
jgi:hypothetical protein